MAPRPSDVPCVHIRTSDNLDNACAKHNAFWYKRRQCKASQRQPSAAAGSGSGADAGSRRLYAAVRPRPLRSAQWLDGARARLSRAVSRLPAFSHGRPKGIALLASATSSPPDRLGRWHVAGEQIVVVGCLLQHRLHVVCQQVAFGHQCLGRLGYTIQIVCFGWIAFFNGETRIPRGFPLALCRREGQRRPHQPHEVVWARPSQDGAHSIPCTLPAGR